MKSVKFEKDIKLADEIFARGEFTKEDRKQLVDIIGVSYHTTGKIESMYSIDSSCNHCSFCNNIRKNNYNPLLICSYCYDSNLEKRFVDTYNRHGLNHRILSSIAFTMDELSQLKIGELCRFNSSGDIENVIHAENYLKIAYTHKNTKFGLFAKNVAPVIQACDNIGKPDNIRFIQSSPIIGQSMTRLAKYFDFQFVVYPDENAVFDAVKKGAKICNGQKCKLCGFKCYLKFPDNCVVAEKLKLLSKKKMEKIIKAYYGNKG